MGETLKNLEEDRKMKKRRGGETKNKGTNIVSPQHIAQEFRTPILHSYFPGVLHSGYEAQDRSCITKSRKLGE